MLRLAGMQEKVGDLEGAEALHRRAADAGDAGALLRLAEIREKIGDLEGAKALRRYGLDPDGMPTSPWP